MKNTSLKLYTLAIWTLLTLISTTGADYARNEARLRKLAKNATFARSFEEHVKKFSSKPKLRATFPCASLTTTPATSVHKLTPADIKVVGALGDSITAGTGIIANTVLGLLRQDRGLSWSIGGDETYETVRTLPNILKMYQPEVAGFSLENGNVKSKNAHLNRAVPGEKSENMPRQARELIDKMKTEPGVNVDNDWKVITLFVGGNDLCDYLSDKTKYSPEQYIANIQEALDMLHAEVPRAFVNLAEVINVVVVKQVEQGLICSTMHLFECNFDDTDVDELMSIVKRYQEVVNVLVDTGRYDTRDDFTVVVQPFWRGTKPPLLPDEEPDFSYFAPDCFHLSEKGHAAAAEALWNNMLQPVGQKSLSWNPGETLLCPAQENPYFYTYLNSGVTKTGTQSGGLGSQRGGLGGLGDSLGDNDGLNATIDNVPQTERSHVAAIVVGSLLGVLAVIVAVIMIRSQKFSKAERGSLLRKARTGLKYEYI